MAFFASVLVVVLGVPSRPTGLADGLPIDHPLEIWIALGLAGAFFVLPWRVEPARAPRLALALVVVALAKLALAGVSLPEGLRAHYYANADFQGPPERSLEWRLDGATRLDRTLDFAPVGFAWSAKPFPLWFFNDIRRFNFYRPGEPDRRRLPFSIHWQGVVRVPTAEPVTWRLATEQEATLRVGGRTVLSTSDGPAEAAFTLAAGWKPIEATYVWRGQGPQSLSLEWAWGERGFQVVPAKALRPVAPTAQAEGWDRWAARLAGWVAALQWLVVGWVVAAGLVGLGRQALRTERLVVYLLVVVMMAFGTVSLSKRGRTPHWNILNGGDDPLVYESAARQIILDRDPLNRMESTTPFFHMVGYRYYLAAAHVLFGESKAMVVMTHYLLLAVACALLYSIVRRLAPPGPSLLAAGLLFAGQAHGSVYRWATELFPAMLGLALVGALLLAVVHWSEEPSTRGAVAVGLIAGIAIISRPNVLVFLPFAVAWIALGPQAPLARRWRGAAVALLAATLTIAPVTWRNWYVSDRFVLLVSSGPTMFFVGNQPPPNLVDYSTIDTDPFYERLNLSPPTRKTLEYLRQQPAAFARGLGRKVFQTLGLVDPFSASLFLLHLGYLAGAVLLWRAGVARRLSVLLHSFVLSQWALLVILKPGPHLPKTQLPTFLVAFAFASLLIVSLAYAAVESHLPEAILPVGPGWSPVRRLIGGLGALGLLVAITYPPRLPLIVLLVVGSVWSLRRASPSRASRLLESVDRPVSFPLTSRTSLL